MLEGKKKKEKKKQQHQALLTELRSNSILIVSKMDCIHTYTYFF